MDLKSPFLKTMWLIMRVGTTFHPQRQLNYHYILLVSFSCALVVFSDLAEFLDHGAYYEILHGQIYEALVFVFFLLNVPILIRKSPNLFELMQLLLEPFNEVSFDVGKNIIKNFIRWVNIIGFTVTFNNFFVIGCCMMALGPLVTLPFYAANTTIQDLPLPVGRIPFYTESNFVYWIFYINSSLAIIATCAFHSSWYLLFIYSSLKIQARLKILVKTMESLEEHAAIRCLVLTEISQCCGRSINKEKMLYQCTEDILGEAICEHIKIIRYVQLVNHTFSWSLLVFIETAVIVDSILLHQITDVTSQKYQTVQEYVYKINMAFAGSFATFMFSLCGQKILNESNNFRSALYKYNWTEKPLKLKQSLLLMMTAVNKPLKITAGGVYPLSMVSYKTNVRVLYSYINLLLYLREN